MCYKVLIVTACVLLCSADSAPALHATSSSESSTATALENVQLVQPQFISIERFEELLKRAGELFAPVQILETLSSASIVAPLPSQSHEKLQSPKAKPYNFYMPLLEHDDTKSEDLKSRRMERLAAPAKSSRRQPSHINYYAEIKPKKLPKKFDAGAKQLNINWLNVFEKEVLESEDMPKTVYLRHDERNRINFDDSFFAVDTPVQITDNEPHKQSKVHASETGEDSYLNQGENMSGEDLVAVASQLPQINRAFSREQREQLS